ncbi:hypothetical protein R1sor_013410 [Riccia sorocarpa]|uniref:beta-glucosidase n=1 Tax=Riccia sorocarpa TaxID=122646 RepID=A0ABD3HAK1_9MARC
MALSVRTRLFVAVALTLFSARFVHAAEIYMDHKIPVELRVKALLSRMTLVEKIGQMMQIERSVANASVIRKFRIGSVLSAGGSTPEVNKPEAWQEMVDSFQSGALRTRLKIPMLYGIDAVHGHNAAYGATIFPHNIGLGCTRDRELVKRIGAVTALELRATGIPYTFAPCVAVCRDPRWGRCYESFSEDPSLVRKMTDVIYGLQGVGPPGLPFVAGRSKVAACAKHYVGDGGTRKGINANNTILSFEDLVKIHMVPYFDAIAKGVSTIMISYSSWNGVKMHANRFLITDVLKGKLRFKGFVISDYQGIDQITTPPDANYTYSVLASINAGIDMVMVPMDYKGFLSNLTSLVNSGFVPMKRIDDAVRRILRVKFSMGLFEHPLAERSYLHHFGVQGNKDVAREAVRKSLVLLKNGKDKSQPFLPLSKKATKILVAGTHADSIGLQCGGWTISWQGSPNDTTKGTTILHAIKTAVSKPTRVLHKASPERGYAARSKADFAVVVVGEPPYAEGRGDNQNLTIPAEGLRTIKNVCPEVKCLVILISGRPLVVQPYLHLMEAFVAAWLPGTQGKGITDVIFGDYEFVGKLSRTWFRSVDQLPMNVGDAEYDPLFPFGYGLRMDIKHKTP